MKKNMIKIAVIIMLISFIFFVMFIPAFNTIVSEKYAVYVVMQIIVSVLYCIGFIQFIEIILFTHKLE